jgi:hypothetical protein
LIEDFLLEVIRASRWANCAGTEAFTAQQQTAQKRGEGKFAYTSGSTHL